MEKPKSIQGVDVVRGLVKKAATLDEFKKLNPDIFSHLTDPNAAYAELFAEFAPAAPEKSAAVTPTP